MIPLSLTNHSKFGAKPNVSLPDALRPIRKKFNGLQFPHSSHVARSQIPYRLQISQSVPDVFSVKLKSCPKSQQILDVIGSPKR